MDDQFQNNTPFTEHRAHTRERIKIKVQYKNVEKLKEDWAENISFGGIFIKTENPLPIHTPVEIALTLPHEGETVVMAAVVVRIVDRTEAAERGISPGFALEFIDFSEKKKAISDFITPLIRQGDQSTAAVIRLDAPSDEPGIPDSGPTPADEPETDELPDDSEHIESKAIQIKNMSVKDKMILAPKADKAERAVLLRDLNASVARLIIRNPRITESEIAQIVKDISTPSDVLELIAKNRKWIQNPEIRLAMAKNPRTPTPLAIAQLNYVQVKDLAILAKSQNVRETIKNEAFKLLLKKRDKVT